MGENEIDPRFGGADAATENVAAETADGDTGADESSESELYATDETGRQVEKESEAPATDDSAQSGF